MTKLTERRGGAGGSGDRAAALIRDLIFDGDLRPGDRVPQDDVAAALGVSRIPVREALIALEREGWVTIEIHRGAYINAFDADALHDHYVLHGLVYSHVGRRALRQGAEPLVPRLRPLCRTIVGSSRPAEIGRCAVAFNAAVVDAAGSSRAEVVLRSMTGLVPGDFFAAVSGAVEVARRGCESVLAAFEAADADALDRAYSTMMCAMGDEVVSVFRARGLLDDGPDAVTTTSAGGADD